MATLELVELCYQALTLLSALASKFRVKKAKRYSEIKRIKESMRAPKYKMK